MENKKILWIGFYSVFANKLLAFESDRKTLLEKLVRVYEKLGIKFPKLERDNSLIDIDPFTVFGMFNKGITITNKISIIKALAKEFEVDDSIEIPTNFDGIPILNNLMAVFFPWDRLNTDDIDNLWTLFRIALNYADSNNKLELKDSFIEAYNKVIKQKCIKWNITMGLYWIRPYTFLSLDSRSRWFIQDYCPDLVNNNIKVLKHVPNGENYLSLCDLIVENLNKSSYIYKNLPELSCASYIESERVNQENRKLTEENSAMVEEDIEPDEKEIIYPPYTSEDFLNDVFMSELDYTTLVELLFEKKNVILQGAPGVGKTFVARRLAYSIMGEQDSERVMMVQFHQSYSYEDFIIGYRPTENGGFVLKKGPFYNFCKKAENDRGNDYFFIIDEINRGNLSKIFGELFMLVEKDKRSKVKLQLLYSDEKFSVPDNIYIIGMMNTADRSLAMLDYALRRRFAFYEMKPGFETDKFIEYRMNLNNSKFNSLINVIEKLNNDIASDDSLGEGFKIGHSYFCNFKNVDDNRLSNIVEYEIIPLLKEYWFDEPNKVKDWSNILRSAIK